MHKSDLFLSFFELMIYDHYEIPTEFNDKAFAIYRIQLYYIQKTYVYYFWLDL